MIETFEELGIAENLATGLHKVDITVPTRIQSQVIPLALLGKDIIGQSATGTGKTLAYLLPLFQKIDPTKREMQAIILTPTNELAIQIQHQVETLAINSGLLVTAVPIIGNVNIIRQIEKLREKPHVIVGTSGRILELIRKKKIAAHTIKIIIIDEADRMLDDKNLDSVKAIIKTTLKERQLMLFSATITKSTIDIATTFMRDPKVIIVTGQSNVATEIIHRYLLTERRDKIEDLRKLVRKNNIERALVFVNRSYDIDITVAKLNYTGLKAAGINRSLVNTDRKKAIEDFREGRIRLLVATDLAARGLDIPGVAYVFNLDLPEDPQVYLHRVGRTGRAGQSGTAISIVTPREATVLINRYCKALKIEILSI